MVQSITIHLDPAVITASGTILAALITAAAVFAAAVLGAVVAVAVAWIGRRR